jgi:hypothetical protein
VPDDLVVVATCSTQEEAAAGLAVLTDRGILASLRPVENRTEIVVSVSEGPAARRALLDDRLEREGRIPHEMSVMMKVGLVIAFLAVVAFAVLTVTLG